MNKIVICLLSIMVLLVACNGSESATQPEEGTGSVAFVTLPSATDTPPLLPSSTPLPPKEQAETPTPTPTLVAEAQPTALAAKPTDTPSPAPSATLTPVPDWLNTFGRTADDLMYLGDPNAPVTVIDFSDFM